MNLIRQVRPGPVGREAGKNSDRAGSQVAGVTSDGPVSKHLKPKSVH